MDDKYIVDSYRMSELQTEKDNLNRRLGEINSSLNEIDNQRKSVANYSGTDMFMGYGVLENNDLDKKDKELREERRKIEERISDINKNIGSINEFDAKRDNLSLQQQQREEMREQRKENFEKVKREWKKRSIFKRAVEHLYGKAPDWNKIANLSPEKLEYLVKVSKGQTVKQQEQDEKSFDRRREEGMHVRDINKMQANMHWNQFVHDLQNGPSDFSVQYEEKESGRVK